MSFIHFFSPLLHRTRHFTRDHQAIAAVEFAVVGPVFIFMIVCFIELGFYYLVELNLSIAMDRAGRQLIIAQDNSPPLDSAQSFVNLMCQSISVIPNCQNSPNLRLQARVYDSSTYGSQLFSTTSNQLIGGINLSDTNSQQQNQQLAWCVGVPGSQILLEAEYMAPVFVTAWWANLTTPYKGVTTHPITLRSLYVREPYAIAGGVGSSC